MARPQPDSMSRYAAPAYVRHKTEQTLLYQLVEQYWPEFQTQLSNRVVFCHGTLRANSNTTCRVVGLRTVLKRVRCESCSHEHLACTRGHKGGPVPSAVPAVSASGKRRSFCRSRLRSSCGARRMVETATLLVNHVLPHRPIRQWVPRFTYPLRFVLDYNHHI